VLQQLYHVPGFCGPLLGMSGDGRQEHEQDEVPSSYFYTVTKTVAFFQHPPPPVFDVSAALSAEEVGFEVSYTACHATSVWCACKMQQCLHCIVYGQRCQQSLCR
jgi:hypothetical protein